MIYARLCVSESLLAWQFEWGNGSCGNIYSNAVVADGQGYSYVTGWNENTATFGITQISSASGTHDNFLAKYNNTINRLWVRSAGGTCSESSASLALDQCGKRYRMGEFLGTA